MQFNTLVRTLAFLVALALGGCAALRANQAEAGWTTLIDGASGMEQWNIIGDANWRAIDGAIQADRKTAPANSFLMTKQVYTDFRVRVEFWASHDANSGIYMRCQDVFNVTDRTCYEANIFDQRADPKYGTGAVVHLAAVGPMPKAGGQWNTFDITVKGGQITVVLNGVRTAEVADGKFASGPIGLQYAAGTIKFRKVQVQPL
ncbi:MAG: DUF1080 domain-containing protein [Burkholderiaceae bacterium]